MDSSLAEDTATLDIVARGRMILGVGLGYQPADCAMFSVPQAERVGLVLFIGAVALGQEQRHFGAATSGTDRKYKRHFRAPTLRRSGRSKG